ncbi:hypothetical protein OIU79_022622 [Salix purpurea]|uniref:Uncharacterized protein n=1 Tax=Salix purpurea TaxID=77065 RepID=A0A9Q1ACZ8_SALPP|nr:hypothetical protein OIU79_022622 [Salix purpurea]
MAQLHLVTVPCSQMRQTIIKQLLVTEQPRSTSSKFNMSAELDQIVLAILCYPALYFIYFMPVKCFLSLIRARNN